MQLLTMTKRRTSDLQDWMPKFKDYLYYPYDRCISRLNFKPDLFRFKLSCEPLSEIKNLNGNSLSWEDCCFQRSQELLKLNKKKYYISYSGGIDSTTAMISLLKNWKPEDLKKIVLFMSHDSILENINFFNSHLKDFPIECALGDASHLLLNDDSVLITGELGDQLFGAEAVGEISKLFGEQAIHYPFTDIAPKLFTQITGSKKTGLSLFERLHPCTAESPIQLNSAFDFFWWINFSQKWQYVKYRFLELETWNPKAIYGKHVLHFYDTLYFQNWSLKNHDLKIKNNWESYKFTAKEYIYNFTKNIDDLNLVKAQSLPKLYNLSRLRLAMDENLKPITSNQELANYARSEAI